jgi:hypothetical protein
MIITVTRDESGEINNKCPDKHRKDIYVGSKMCVECMYFCEQTLGFLDCNSIDEKTIQCKYDIKSVECSYGDICK